MRTIASFAAIFTLLALPGGPLADSAVVGSWAGEAQITSSWVLRRELAVRLDIREDGAVVGTVGDARLLDARIFPASRVARAMRLARQYVPEGSLSGAVIRAEGIERHRVHLSLDRSGHTLTGDLQTSGSYDGSPSELLITARGLVLHRSGSGLAIAPRVTSASAHADEKPTHPQRR